MPYFFPIIGYLENGFLVLQKAMQMAIIQDLNSTAEVDDVFIRLKRFPYPPYINDP